MKFLLIRLYHIELILFFVDHCALTIVHCQLLSTVLNFKHPQGDSHGSSAVSQMAAADI
jgi:hypothetical protein